jgi:poly[(R)-3-hydroxyalkanoate] polymerase subunit PhaC
MADASPAAGPDVQVRALFEDHIARLDGTVPLLDLVSSDDVTHLNSRGGHIGLMAGSKARHESWPEIADWLRERSSH